MMPYWSGEDVTVYHGDCVTVIAGIPDNSIDAIVTDPPYELAFMSKRWDATGVAFDPATWAECLRVLKPGAHCLAFGGTRTWHRLACAVEDAGFEIRDSLAWLYGSGFPKSLDVSKAIDKAAGAERQVIGKSPHSAVRKVDIGYLGTGHDEPERLLTAPATDAAQQWQGWGTALKPAFEPIVFARKPLTGTVAQNVTTWGTGALNIEGCRIGTDDDLNGGAHSGAQRQRDEYTSTDTAPGAVPFSRMNCGIGEFVQPAGRWPANVVLDTNQAAVLDKMSGDRKSSGVYECTGDRRNPGGKAVTDFGNDSGMPGTQYDDFGGPSRFFPVFRYEAKAPSSERPSQHGIQHATVKPLALMQWLVRLVTPPGGTVLDPFAGSGTTGEAAVREGFKTILIEQEADYLPLILERFRRPINYIMDFGEDAS